MTCCHCDSTDRQFDAGIARRDLRRLRRRGPDLVTRRLFDAVKSVRLPPDATLLDVGGGVGAIHHFLLDHGFSRATQVDASTAYLEAAEEETVRVGHDGRVEFRFGGFPAAAADVAPADVVTMDRVVCCDPDFSGLLGSAADKARRLLAFSYPRPRWSIKLVVAAANAWRRLFGQPFRAYVHRPEAMTSVLESRGLRRRWAGGTWIWAVELFERAA
ncbi:MAG TPA: methyltransferase domain-containing protein [Gemmatimonadales bacterium]|nr:methyltransferase domain-containing protein [Gemmatimonadales bacterium]